MKRLASDSLVYGLSGVFSKMLNLILLPLYANMFTVSEYGVLAILAVFTSIASQVVVLQLDSGAFRFILDRNNTEDVKVTLSSWFWTQFIFSCLVLAGGYLFKSQISLMLFSTSDYSMLILLSLLVLPLNAVENVCITYWRIHSRKWPVTIANVVGVFLLLVLNYYFVSVLKLGIVSLAWSALLVGILKSVFLLPFINHLIHPARYNMERLKGMLKYCLPFVPAGISLWIVTLIDRIILEKYTGTTEVGIYQMAYNIASLLMMPIGAFLQAWSPYVFSILENPDHKKIIAKWILIFTVSTSILAFLSILFNSELLVMLTSPSYYISNTFVPILLFSNISMGLYQLSGIGSAIAKKTTNVMWATILSAGINILLNLILIPRYQIAGASWATFISYAIIPVFLFYVSQKVYPIPYNFKLIMLSMISLFILSLLTNKFFENFDIYIRFLAGKIVLCLTICGLLFYFFRKKRHYFT